MAGINSIHQKQSGFGSMEQKPKKSGPGNSGKTDDAFIGGFPGKTRKGANRTGYRGPSVATAKF